MENINLDNIEVKEGEFKKYLTEDGEYVVSITSVDQGVSTNTGTPYLKFECKTENDEYINISLYLTEKAMWRFKKFIMALGHPGTGTVNPLQIANQCIGRSLKIICNHPETIDPVTNQKVAGKYLEVKDFMAC